MLLFAVIFIHVTASFCWPQRALIYDPPLMTSRKSDLMAKASDALGFALLQKIPRSGNVFISPISISTLMGLVYVGAKNKTASEMRRTLGYDALKLQPEDVPVGHKQIMDTLKQETKGRKELYSLEIANAMLVDKAFDIRQSFREKGRQFYDAAVESVSFSTQPEAALESINGWASWKTRNKITHILQEPLDSLTKLFLLNAVYFKGTWKIRFDQRLTMPDTFYNEGMIPMTVPMMRQKKKFNYGFVTQLQSHALELEYDGNDIKMLILLPEKRDGLQKLESLLTREMVENIPKTLREVTVQVTLPRFRLEEEYDMIPIFKSMGIRSLFDADKVDLTGISPQKGLYVNKIIHKSVIDVNEEGSEAATVTGVAAGVRTGGPLHPSFTADHPFMFFIRDIRTNALLFIGRVNNL